MYTKKQYSEPNILSSGNIKTIIGIVLSILVFIFAILVIMLKSNFSLFGLTVIKPNEDELLALDPNSLVFMKSVSENKLPPRGELVTFTNEGEEIIVRVIDYEEVLDGTVYHVTGGGFVEHKINSEDLVRQGAFLIPNMGAFASFLVTPAGLLVCLGLPLVSILVLLLMHFMNFPQKTGDYKFSQVETNGYFAGATANNTNQRSKRGRKVKNAVNDPYASNYENSNQNDYGYANQNNYQQNNGYDQNNHYNQDPYHGDQYQESQYSKSNNYDNQNNNMRKKPTIESILADVTGNSYNFEEDDDFELDYTHNQVNETMPLNYTKPETVNTDPEANNLIVTREFFIAELQPEEVTKAHEYTRGGVGFQANLNDYEKNNFNIDGIDVNVDSNNIQLAITEDNDSDIFITVTEEFTNVVVNKENLETSFALFKDDQDEKNKVIIRKKQLG